MLQRYVFNYLVVCYILVVIVINAVADISIDYYFGIDGPVRSSYNFGDCKTEEKSIECLRRCGPEHVCLLGQCFCVNVIKMTKASAGRPLGKPISVDIGSESYGGEDDDNEDENSSSSDSSYSGEQLSKNSALRHHIAHFCPNLDEARVCIRKCLQMGKPAFCGKDHNCYCGHQYDFPGKAPEMTAADVQGQFKDLYEKYFGPRDPD